MAGPAWLILPTFNEADNIESLALSALGVLQSAAPEGYRVLIVDDASPDGTGEIADALAARSDEVQVLHRPRKGGLGRAYLAGFEFALEGGAGHVLEMDSDFSHDPADIARLLDAAHAGADLVLGSRYVAGGGVTEWNAVRRGLSRGGCLYARSVLGVGVRDLTGGFKCFRRETLEDIDLSSVRSEGYAFQIELTYRALRRGFEVVEVPITFHERRQGESKMSGRIALEAIVRVPQMRLQRQ